MPRRYTRYQPTNHRRWTHECEHCHCSFISSRPDAKYHSAACREAARRARIAEAHQHEAEEEARRQAIADAKACARLKVKAKRSKPKKKRNSRRR